MDREEIARIEVGHTNVDARLARAMVAGFLLIVAAFPLIEIAGRTRPVDRDNAWAVLVRIPQTIGGRVTDAATDDGRPWAWQQTVTANRALLGALGEFETALEDQSAVGRLLRPPTQALLASWAGAGNERVYVGRDGWLFYRPDVEYVTGRGFLDERQRARRVASASEYEEPPQPDPRPAILAFQRELQQRGITLILMPTPVKPSVHPGQLSRAWQNDGGVVQNASYNELVSHLNEHGVLVFDPSEVIAQSDRPQYLATDTHWRPQTVERVAAALAAFVRERVELPPMSGAGYTVQRREARNVGDTAIMLDLPEGQTLYPPERVTLRYVTDAGGDPWRASRDADVLLLGDSFSNIYSLESMGWGEAAGLAEQLSLELQRPLDRIVQNDQGAYATRDLLRRDAGRLVGKRVVIWQFAAREFAAGDWKEWPPDGR